MRAYEFVNENFADGKKPGRKGLAKRSGVNTKASVSSLRKTAKNSSGEKARMAHWLANMKAGRARKEDVDEGWKDWVAGAALGAAALGANAGIVYQPVERGDTVFSIARQNGVSPQEIMKLNHFNKDTKLVKGQKIKVPDTAKEVPVAKSVEKKPEVKTAVLPQASKQEVSTTVSGSPHEAVLKRVAVAAGIKGTELAAFLAQCSHETGDFKHVKEIGGKLDFKKYDPRFAPRKAKTLGNTKAGDGARYKGRGYIQLTGRDNYKRAGIALGLPLEQNPELVEKPEIAAKVAVWFWKNQVAPKVNNFNDVEAVTKPINPGLKGLDNRQSAFKDYKLSMASR